MKKYALLIQYDGARFSGFQFQKNGASVQGFLEKTIAVFTRHPITIYGAGRTDAGVHALGQVVHFETPHILDTQALAACINFFGRNAGVSVTEITDVSHIPNFHARFSARARAYVYVLQNRLQPSILMQGRCYHLRQKLNLTAMECGASKLLGTHDFESFRARACQAKHAMRTLESLTIESSGDFILFHVRAPSFLHNQVRIMVGTLVMIGQGKEDPTWVDMLLEKRDRTLAGVTAPACGLYFKHVDYGDEIFKTPPSLCAFG